MHAVCEYCHSSVGEDGAVNCPNCGAPLPAMSAPSVDFRLCPYCNRKLLSMGSPACNYCGKRLPDEFIKAREADLNRIAEISSPQPPSSNKIAEAISNLRGDKRDHSSLASDLTDLFS